MAGVVACLVPTHWKSVVCCLFLLLDMYASQSSQQQQPEKAAGFRLWSEGPNFDTDLPQDVTGVVGRTAYLTCRVFERNNKTISWIRHSDLHILTVGRYTYTADMRYQSIYNSATDEWILQIKFLRESDRGMYECQVSTQPVRSFFVRLNVLDTLPSERYDESAAELQNDSEGYGSHSITEIVSGKEVHVEKGSTLNLTCIIRNSVEKPHFLLWYYNQKTIDYTSPRGGISVVNSDDLGRDISSTLLMYQVSKEDSGNYSCKPSNSAPASVIVYVIENERQENLVSSSLLILPSSLLVLSLCSLPLALFPSSATL